jgi:hypothetical protein
VTIECRGLEFVAFDPSVRSPQICNWNTHTIFPQGTWKCIGTNSGTVFPEVQLEEGEWSDYDEKVRVLIQTLQQAHLT